MAWIVISQLSRNRNRQHHALHSLDDLRDDAVTPEIVASREAVQIENKRNLRIAMTLLKITIIVVAATLVFTVGSWFVTEYREWEAYRAANPIDRTLGNTLVFPDGWTLYETRANVGRYGGSSVYICTDIETRTQFRECVPRIIRDND